MRWSGLLNETLCLCPTPLEEMCSWIKRLCFWQNSLQAHTSEAEHKNIVSRMKVRFESAVVGARRKGSFTSQPTPTNTNLCKSSTCDHSPTTVHITSLHWRCSRVVCIFVCLQSSLCSVRPLCMWVQVGTRAASMFRRSSGNGFQRDVKGTSASCWFTEVDLRSQQHAPNQSNHSQLLFPAHEYLRAKLL